MTNRRTSSVHFAGSGPRSAPFNWGQRALWKSIELSADGDHWWLNRPRMLNVEPYALTAEQVAQAVASVVSRHETLRTRLAGGAGEPLRQEVVAAGELPVELVDVDVAPADAFDDHDSELFRVADQLYGEFLFSSFDLRNEFPIRLGIVSCEGVARVLVLAYCHLYVDTPALNIVARDLELALGGEDNPHPIGETPCELALRESQLGEQTAAAVKYWIKVLETIPRQQVGGAVDPRPPQGYGRLLIHSREVSDALWTVAQGSLPGTSHTAALSAAALTVSKFVGCPRVGLVTNVANRHQPGHKDIVGILLQRTLLSIDTTGADEDDDALRKLVSRVYLSTLKAYRHSHYDQLELDRQLDAMGRGGSEIDPFILLNDVTQTRQAGVPPAAIEGELPPPEWTSFTSFDWRLYIELIDTQGVVRLGTVGDLRYFTHNEIEDVARTFEKTLARIAALSGGAPPIALDSEPLEAGAVGAPA